VENDSGNDIDDLAENGDREALDMDRVGFYDFLYGVRLNPETFGAFVQQNGGAGLGLLAPNVVF
jgi:hypothetical protein